MCGDSICFMDFQSDSRVSVRLPICTPPSSLTLARVSNNHFVTWLNVLEPAKLVGQVGSLGAGLFQPSPHSHPDRAVVSEQCLEVLINRINWLTVKLELLVCWSCHRPTPVNVTWSIATWPRCVRHNELDDMYKLPSLIRETLHDVLH